MGGCGALPEPEWQGHSPGAALQASQPRLSAAVPSCGADCPPLVAPPLLQSRCSYNGPARSTCHNEQWSLREVSPADLRRLAAAAGLSVVRQLARWADGWASDGSEAPACSDDEARVFVLGR